MNATLDELYLTWLYSLVGDVESKRPSRTYWSLLSQLFCKEFVWLVPNDDNRLEDGRDLRYEFRDTYEIEEIDPDWMSLGCSFLELLIGLSRRLSFEAEGEPRVWFWHLLEVLDLYQYNDNNYNKGLIYERIEDILDTVIWRTYDRDGKGGLFPLRNPEKDQRHVEIWYQMNAYLIEHGL